jgi:hypothetical protein
MPANTPLGISYPLYSDAISTTQAQFQDMATDMDTLVQQLEDRLTAASTRPTCKLSGIANQLVAPATNVTVVWAAEDFDNDNMANIGVNATRIQLIDQGIYLVGASIALSNTLGTYGVSATIVNSAGVGGGVQTMRGVSGNLDTTPGQTYINPQSMVYADGITTVDVTVVVRQNSAAGINIQDRNFWATKVSNGGGGF